MDLTYGQGTLFDSRVSGYMAQDLVTFGAYEVAQLKIPNSLFGLALTVSQSFSNVRSRKCAPSNCLTAGY